MSARVSITLLCFAISGCADILGADGPYHIVGPSCDGLANTCGAKANESCCSTGVAPSGTFDRSSDQQARATLSEFRLDRFEVTVGRFRNFVEAYPASVPRRGDGEHPHIANSGWIAAWDANLPLSRTALESALQCESSFTWTPTAGANENLPINCVSWYVAFAFCAWDGGRLPTEAEWNYAAAGGSEQRVYPWSTPANSTKIDGTFAVYDCFGDTNCDSVRISPVGSRSPKGDGKWNHADLSGNMREWVFDFFDTYVSPCTDCAKIEMGAAGRSIRGGSYISLPSELETAKRDSSDATFRSQGLGFRCARDIEPI